MLPIYVMYDSGLDSFEQNCINEAMLEFKKLFPERKIANFGSRAWSEGDYSSADWYIEHAKYRQMPFQIDALSLINLMEDEPWQKDLPHIDVFFTSRDLTVGGLSYCFGIKSGRFTVQSAYRYRYLYDNEKRKWAIKAVIWHELGHVFGMASDLNRSNTEDRLGHHCTNYGCVMRQGESLNEWIKNTREVKEVGMIYCPQCMQDMRKSKL